MGLGTSPEYMDSGENPHSRYEFTGILWIFWLARAYDNPFFKIESIALILVLAFNYIFAFHEAAVGGILVYAFFIYDESQKRKGLMLSGP